MQNMGTLLELEIHLLRLFSKNDFLRFVAEQVQIRIKSICFVRDVKLYSFDFFSIFFSELNCYKQINKMINELLEVQMVNLVEKIKSKVNNESVTQRWNQSTQLKI